MFPFIVLLLVIAIVLFIISISALENNLAISFLSGIIILIIGIYTLTNGFYGINNFTTQVVGLILISISIYIGLVASLDSINVTGFGGGEE